MQLSPSQGDARPTPPRSRECAGPSATGDCAGLGPVEAQVDAAEIALNGVREEARVGQRTTLDVLNAQQELVNARVAVVVAQRDRIVASYTLMGAVGRLSPQVRA
jgi:outer membrane protein